MERSFQILSQVLSDFRSGLFLPLVSFYGNLGKVPYTLDALNISRYSRPCLSLAGKATQVEVREEASHPKWQCSGGVCQVCLQLLSALVVILSRWVVASRVILQCGGILISD